MKRMRYGKEAGFSLVELVTVAAIIVVVAAIAVPNMMNAIYNIRLSSSASSVATMLLATRQQAVKDNLYDSTCWTTATPGATLWMAKQGSACGSSASGITQVQLNSTVQIVNSGPSVPPVSGYTPQTSGQPTFSARGVPCVAAAVNSPCFSNVVSGASQTVVGYAVYLKQVRSSGSTDWAAVTVSPAGRVQKWRYTGSGWTQ